MYCELKPFDIVSLSSNKFACSKEDITLIMVLQGERIVVSNTFQKIDLKIRLQAANMFLAMLREF